MTTFVDILTSDKESLASLNGKTFLITGGHGMLGRAFARQLTTRLPESKVLQLGRADLDVRNPAAFGAWEVEQPDFVIHCAALVDADYCEDHEDEGRISIVEGTRNVADFAQRCGAKLLYPQSFLIFDGAASPIDEGTLPRPLGVYGRLKVEAESCALAAHARNLSVRMAGFFGGGEKDTNFVGRIVPHFAKLIREGKRQIDIGTRVWQPTYTEDLAANCLLLLAHDRQGVYCMASHGSASFHELASEIIHILGLQSCLSVGIVDASILASREKARRPLLAIIRNARMQSEALDRQRTWQASLAEYIQQPYFQEMFR